jgi:hypothetical protein
MGSLTQASSQQIFSALFPTGATSHTAASLGTTASGFRIYNTTNTAGQVGIFAGNAAVIHQMTLILGTGDASSNPVPGIPLVDGNVLGNSLSSTPTPSAGTITFANQASYPNSGLIGGSVAMGNPNTWLGWTLDADGTKARARNNGSITFPTLTSGPKDLWGWCISSIATAANTGANPASTTQLLATANTPVIIAYGDLSFARRISSGDTPSFTNNAVVITLD